MISARGNPPPAQRNSLSLARVLFAAAIPASIIAGFVTAFIVAFTLADSPPFDRRGLDVTIAATNAGFYGGLATDVLAQTTNRWRLRLGAVR
jgi:hypothetical protein